MDRIAFLISLEQSASLSKGTKTRRVMKSPVRVPYSYLLQYASQRANMSLKIKAKTFWGEYMYVVIPEIVSMNIYRYGFFEEGLTRMVLNYVKPGMTFFDIGTHFGYFSLLASTIVGEGGQVHSFEPTPSTFSILKLNASGRNNIFLNNKAVLSKEDILTLNDCGLIYSSHNSLYDARLPRKILENLNINKINVQGISVDEYVQKVNVKPDFVKIDAESAEYEILLGMEETIKASHPIISLEVGDMGVNGVLKSKDIIVYLRDKGYQPYEFKGGKLLRHELRETYKFDNILFLPEKSCTSDE